MKDASAKKNPDNGTWTIRPDKDVRKAVAEFLKNNPDYDRTEIINEALRLRLPDAVTSLLHQELARIKAQLARLDRAKKPLNSLKNAKGQVLEHIQSRASKLAPGKRQ